MIPSRQINYFRIGSFVIVGICLMVITIILFGSGIFKKKSYIETYFGESVQGLSVGSPVKYLGMEIGYVKEIDTVDNIYPEARPVHGQTRDRFIYVRMAITKKFFKSDSLQELRQELARDVDSGLRMKLALQGLTGNAYIELDFMNPKQNPPPKISWRPQGLYVPSTTSTLTYFSENVKYLLGELKEIDFKKFFDKLQGFVGSANEVTNRMNGLLAHTSGPIIDAVNNLHTISDNVSAITDQAKGFPSSIVFGRPPPKLDLNDL